LEQRGFGFNNDKYPSINYSADVSVINPLSAIVEFTNHLVQVEDVT